MSRRNKSQVMSKDQKASEEQDVIFHLEGGLGKNVAATAVLRAIRKKHPNNKIIAVVSYPEVFLMNPNPDRVYRVGNSPYFWADYIKDKNPIIYKHEPYFTSTHINKQKHLIDSWCDVYGLENDNKGPELPMNIIQSNIGNKFKRDKPILLIQTNGGPLQNQPFDYSWARDIPRPYAEAIVKAAKSQFHIMQVCRTDSQVIEGVDEVFNKPLSNMELFSLLKVSAKRVLIDSCLQHAAAAFNLPSTVLWIATSPVQFGYKMHKNVVANPPKREPILPDSYLFDYQFHGVMHECPYTDVNEMFDINTILKNI